MPGFPYVAWSSDWQRPRPASFTAASNNIEIIYDPFAAQSYMIHGVSRVKDKSGRVVGSIDGDAIKSAGGSRIGSIDKGTIKDARGTRVGYVDGSTVKDARGSRVGSIDKDHIKDARGATIGSYEGGLHSAAGAAAILLLL